MKLYPFINVSSYLDEQTNLPGSFSYTNTVLMRLTSRNGKKSRKNPPKMHVQIVKTTLEHTEL
jgi:hypothetical protein